MKKRNLKINDTKKRFLNRLGMTYVELLCALSLLSLIVVMFTPMLLSSYENLYKAGEKVEEVYDSKEEIERGLATRFSEITVGVSNFQLSTNAQLLFESLNVNGKKVVSSLQQGLETVFGNGRVSVDIVSPKVVYDDQSNHDVVIQTTGLEYSLVQYGSYSSKYSSDEAFLAANEINLETGGKGIIFVEVIIPDKSKNVSGGTTIEESAYISSNIATLKFANTLAATGQISITNTDNEGIIEFNVSGRTGTPLDFTQSPVKINVFYVNTRGQVKQTSDYLIIEPPTMMFAGDTNSSVDYYTSAGVQEEDGVYSLNVEARKMRIDNSGYLTAADTPGSKGAKIQTITWVDADENQQLRPYYVMAGTNSSVYRMYNYRVKTDINTVFGISGTTNTNEGSLILSDGSMAHPSFWSGEMSDQYYFKTLSHSAGYGTGEYVSTDCTAEQGGSYDGGSRNHAGSNYDAFDKTLRYMMMFNGFTTGYDYQHLANRRLSYVLTEAAGGYSFRLGGKLGNLDEYDGYSMPWEPSSTYYFGGGNKVTWKSFLGIATETRIIGGTSKDSPYEGVVYFQGSGSGGENKHYDRHLAYIRIKSSVSVDPIAATIAQNADYLDRFMKGDFWVYKGDDAELKDVEPNDYDWLSTNHANSVNVTSSVYLPNAGSSGQGQVIYFGTVPAYAFVRQSSDIGTTDDARFVYNGENIKASRATGYVISGTQGNGSTIYRAYSSDKNDNAGVSDMFKFLCLGQSGVLTEQTNRSTFYNYSGSDILYYNDSDLEFTFGYCSRWRMAMGDVTSNGEDEEARSYEKYYKASNPSAQYLLARGQLNNQGENNLYYNVWFPGEYYNLTQVATLDEVTVAVGYAVSGSVFMKESAALGAGSGYYGTALGSVYNDGVMAAYVSEEAGGKVYNIGLSGKGERNVIFQNLLYYKMPTFVDSTLHSRASVRFTAVDLVSFTENGNKSYMAVYGDNHGRLFFSTIATSTVSNPDGLEGEAKESNVVLRSASSTNGGTALTTADMIELTFDDNNPYAIVGTTSLSTIFTEITSIEAGEDIVIVTGKARDGQREQFVILERPDPSQNTWTMKRIYNGNFYGTINKAMILGDYYYIVGDGWIAAASIDGINATANGGTLVSSSGVNTTTNKNELIWCETDVNGKNIGSIYALDGRITEG